MNYWQIAAGEGARDYSDVFLKYGVMLVGPGDPGHYFQNQQYYHTHNHSRVITLAQGIQPSDIVVLKRPHGRQWEILAVGVVQSGYDYLPVFDDVEGWDLQHARYVKWVKPKAKVLVTGLTRGTLKGINNQSVIQTAVNILNSGNYLKPCAIPQPKELISDEDLIYILINNGLRPKDAEDLAQTIRQIRRLVKWYNEKGKDVTEHETRTFLIIPLLLALGWSEQRLKIEWNNIDIAFFEEPYCKNVNSECIIILESKRLWEGLDYAAHQVSTYASKYPKCDKLIVSDGLCYRLYKKIEANWNYSAYLNILKLREKHPYYPNIGGAPDVFLNLMVKR